MNKKITPRVIKLIVIQSIILIVAVTTVGAAINVHSEYKNTGKTVNAQIEITTNTGAKSLRILSINTTTGMLRSQ